MAVVWHQVKFPSSHSQMLMDSLPQLKGRTRTESLPVPWTAVDNFFCDIFVPQCWAPQRQLLYNLSVSFFFSFSVICRLFTWKNKKKVFVFISVSHSVTPPWVNCAVLGGRWRYLVSLFLFLLLLVGYFRAWTMIRWSTAWVTWFISSSAGAALPAMWWRSYSSHWTRICDSAQPPSGSGVTQGSETLH